jgi:NAD(P)-dependent dehydrogenase (short-subunit alcohol dehydrogenase family)
MASSERVVLYGVLAENKVYVNAVNPGVVNTNAHRHMPFKTSSFIRISFAPFIWFLMKLPDDGAQTGIYLVTAEEMAEVTGKYYK